MQKLILALFLSLFSSSVARAQHHTRAIAEETLLLGGLFANYIVSVDLNSRDWDYEYTLKGVQGKFSLSGAAFDTNGYTTNFKMHPIAGYMYYTIARSNKISPFGSFAYSFLASIVWEYLIEFREKASLNDIIVTPVAGFVLGEANYRLAQAFRCKSRVPSLGAALMPLSVLHETIDDETRDCDGLDFKLEFAAMMQFSQPGSMLGIEASLETLPPQSSSALVQFTDARVVKFDVHAYTGTWNYDHRFQAAVHPFGWSSSSALVTFPVIFDTYTRMIGYQDKYAMLSLPSILLAKEFKQSSSSVRFSTGLAVLTGGIDTLALSLRDKSNPVSELPSVTLHERYSFVGGIGWTPSIMMQLPFTELGSSFSLGRFWAFTAADRFKNGTAEIREHLDEASMWVHVGDSLQLKLRATWIFRRSYIDDLEFLRTTFRTEVGLSYKIN